MMKPQLANLSWTLVTALGLASAMPATGAPGLRLSGSTGLPQVSQTGGEAFGWQYRSLRADTPLLRLEWKTPSCLAAERSAASLVAGRAATAGLLPMGCDSPAGELAPRLLNQRFSARWRQLPTLPGDVDLQLTWRSWHAGAASRQLQAEGRRASRGSEAELEASRDFATRRGLFTAFAGQAQPLSASADDGLWRTRYAGLNWRPQRRHLLEWTAEHGRDLRWGDIDRQWTARWSYTQSSSSRWNLQLVRHLDDSLQPWRLSLGAQWAL
jgi:hypothetical protein